MKYTIVYELPDDPGQDHEHEFEAENDDAAKSGTREYLATLAAFEWADLYGEDSMHIDWQLSEVFPKGIE